MNILRYLPLALTAVFVSCDSDETTLPPEPEITGVELVDAFPGTSFSQPLDLQVPNDGSGRVFVVEKGGRVVLAPGNGATQASTFLQLSNISTASEQGLLGLAFHPEFANNGFFYVFYTPNSELAVVSRFSTGTSGNVVDPDSEVVLLEIPQPLTNHNGGQLAFGPDGHLYIAIGDGGGGGDPQNNAQNRANLLGNILRINVDAQENGQNYAIPVGNPFLDEPNVRPEIFAYGFRNPWRMSFDAQTGNLWTGDVGQGDREEINMVEVGGNYGWKLFEGTFCFSGDCDADGLQPPVFEYNHDNGDRSITGGFVYRGSLNPSLIGKYIYGDFVSGRVWALDLGNDTNELLFESRLSITSFGVDQENELYICSFDGSIYKIVPKTEELTTE